MGAIVAERDPLRSGVERAVRSPHQAAAAKRDDMIIVTGSVVARDDAVDEARDLSLQHVRRSRTEPGCLLHSVHHDVEQPNRLVFLEHWADMDSLKAHFAVPESSQFVRAVTTLAVTAPEMQIFDATELHQ
jgi:quinol monooxygenase YgiN